MPQLGEVPFRLGETERGTSTDGAGTLTNTHLEGLIGEFYDIDYEASGIRGGKSIRTGRKIVAICCRNTSTVALLGKRLGRMERDTTNIREVLGRVNGYADETALDLIGVIDHNLPSGGVAVNDFFWLIVEGPTTLLTPVTGAAFTGDIAAHAPLVCGTFATSTNASAGRPANVTFGGTTNTTLQGQYISNQIGWALTARTTQESTDGTEIDIVASIRY